MRRWRLARVLDRVAMRSLRSSITGAGSPIAATSRGRIADFAPLNLLAGSALSKT